MQKVDEESKVNNSTRLIVFSNMKDNLPYISQQILLETEAKCFTISKTQETYCDLMETAMNLYKQQQIFYAKIMIELQKQHTQQPLPDVSNNEITNSPVNNIENNESIDNKYHISVSNESKQEKLDCKDEKSSLNKSNLKDYVKELVNRLRTSTDNADKSRVLKEIKNVSPEAYVNIIISLHKHMVLNEKSKKNEVLKHKLDDDDDETQLESDKKKFKNDDNNEANCPICFDTIKEVSN